MVLGRLVYHALKSIRNNACIFSLHIFTYRTLGSRSTLPLSLIRPFKSALFEGIDEARTNPTQLQIGTSSSSSPLNALPMRFFWRVDLPNLYNNTNSNEKSPEQVGRPIPGHTVVSLLKGQWLTGI
jgi:hypothetical protein